MSIFDKIFQKGPKKERYVQMLNGSLPVYSQFGTNIYMSDVVQQVLKCIVDEIKKLQPTHIRQTDSDPAPIKGNIQNVLDNPNPLMTSSEFFEKITWLLLLNYNAFILPVYYTWTEKDSKGNFKLEKTVTDISAACTTKPENLQTAFASGNQAKINVYPISSEKSIASYDITYFPYAGDADMDDHVSSADASYILSVYSALATGNTVTYAATQKKRMDVDGNGRIEPADASLVLGFYANASVEEHPTWKKVLENAQ